MNTLKITFVYIVLTIIIWSPSSLIGQNNNEIQSRREVVLESISTQQFNLIKPANDKITLRHFSPMSDNASIWFVSEKGYVHGYNAWLDLAKATGFVLPDGLDDVDTISLTEVRIWWGKKCSDVTDQTYSLNILPGTIAEGPDTSGSPFYSEVFPLSEINADENSGTNLGPTVYTFDPPISVPPSFFVSTYLGEYEEGEYLAAIYATSVRGEFVAEDWQQRYDGSWHNISNDWWHGTDGVHMWIEAVVELPEGVVIPPTEFVEIHEFGATNAQYYIYSDGRTWEFEAEHTGIIDTLEVKSVLASTTSGGTFYIQVSIQDSVIANWSCYIRDTSYKPYIHTKKVSHPLTQGDKIVYKISGGSFSTPVGGITGISYVKFISDKLTHVAFNDLKPLVFQLSQNYPNPFNPSTVIRYSIPERNYVLLSVYNTLGQKIAQLIDNEVDAGIYEITFDASHLPSGVYIYRLQAGEFVESKKLLLLK